MKKRRAAPRDREAACYAWRERFAISLEGGATERTARRVATLECPDFTDDARAGRFDFVEKKR